MRGGAAQYTNAQTRFTFLSDLRVLSCGRFSCAHKHEYGRADSDRQTKGDRQRGGREGGRRGSTESRLLSESASSVAPRFVPPSFAEKLYSYFPLPFLCQRKVTGMNTYTRRHVMQHAATTSGCVGGAFARICGLYAQRMRAKARVGAAAACVCAGARYLDR